MLLAVVIAHRRPLLLLCAHLLPDRGLIMVFHLVQAIGLEVIHQDGEAAHDLGLLFDAARSAAAALQVHLVAYPVNLLIVELDAAAIIALAGDGAESLVAHLLSRVPLVSSDDALGPLVQVQIPSVINLFESALFELPLGSIISNATAIEL